MKRSFFVAFIVPFLLTAFYNSACGQSAEEAISLLKELKAKTGAGASYGDYMQVLSDAQREVNLFSETGEARAKPRLTNSIEKALLHFRFAGILFEDRISGKECLLAIPKEEEPRLELIRRLHQAMLEETECIVATYPETEAAITREWDGGCSPGYMRIGKAIRVIWQEASKELHRATRLHSELSWSVADKAVHRPQKEEPPRPTGSTIYGVQKELVGLEPGPRPK